MDKLNLLYKAEYLRKKWALNDSSDIFSAAVEHLENLTLLCFPMDDNMRGCCVRTEKDMIICINSIQTRGMQNFTLVHELYHMLFGIEEYTYSCTLNSGEGEEKNADAFASYLLMPTVSILEFRDRHKIDNWRLNDVIKCEEHFRVSHSLMLERLLEENLIGDEEYFRFKKATKWDVLKLGYDLSLYEKPEAEFLCLGRIVPLAERAYAHSRISKGKYEEILLNIFRDDIVYGLNGEEEILG